MDVWEATQSYEAWLRRKTALYEPDLELKHQKMANSPFEFLRGTFYRWIQVWPEVCCDLAHAPQVLAVGDLHVENFGTWRDSEGRLIWGVNDFDEAYPLSYPLDLVRLSTSAALAIQSGALSLSHKHACRAVLRGYREGLEAGGRAFVLAEENTWLRDIACEGLRDPEKFWKKIEGLPAVDGEPPTGALRAVESLLPEPSLPYRLLRRAAGLGSLGRQRYVALSDWQGGKVAREAKALAPSACAWTCGAERQRTRYRKIVRSAVRCPDPCAGPVGRWVVRRLSPDCCKIDLGALSRERDEEHLLYAMGWETANVHLGSKKVIPRVLEHLDARPGGWLCEASCEMAARILDDWSRFREHAGRANGKQAGSEPRAAG